MALGRRMLVAFAGCAFGGVMGFLFVLVVFVVLVVVFVDVVVDVIDVCCLV